jgi:hypothetical protein
MSLAGLLAPYGLTDEEFLAQLAGALRSRPNPAAASLTASELRLLVDHSGVKVPADEPVGMVRSWLGNLTSNLAEQLQSSLTVAEAAILLDISESRVRYRVHEGALYAFKAPHQLRLPRWQLHREKPLPGLRSVLASDNRRVRATSGVTKTRVGLVSQTLGPKFPQSPTDSARDKKEIRSGETSRRSKRWVLMLRFVPQLLTFRHLNFHRLQLP